MQRYADFLVAWLPSGDDTLARAGRDWTGIDPEIGETVRRRATRAPRPLRLRGGLCGALTRPLPAGNSLSDWRSEDAVGEAVEGITALSLSRLRLVAEGGDCSCAPLRRRLAERPVVRTLALLGPPGDGGRAQVVTTWSLDDGADADPRALAAQGPHMHSVF